MKDYYSFNKFCALLSNSTILKESTAIGVSHSLKNSLVEIKSQVLLQLVELGENRVEYLDYLSNEILKQDYLKDIGEEYISKWLKKYDITIDDIFKEQDDRNEIYKIIDRHYNDMRPFSPEKDEAFLIQTGFLNYFCCYYANELLSFLETKKESNIKNLSILKQTMKNINEEYLIAFCNSISNEREIKKTCFDLLYQTDITHYTPYLESEIIANLLHLPNEKKDDYIRYTLDRINKTPLRNTSKNILDKWLKKYNVDLSNFPKFSNEELNIVLKTYYNGYTFETHQEQHFILDIQIDFYCYAAMLEAEKMISFLESNYVNNQKSSENIKLKWIGKPSQLGFIIANLVDLGYLEAPLHKDGEINFTQLAKLVIETFEIESTENTLSKYLNLNSEKGQETIRKFQNNNFSIPHVKTIS